MSELPIDTIATQKQNDLGPNYFGYYKEVILALISQNQDTTLPFMGLESQCSTGACSGGGSKHNYDEGKEVNYSMSEGLSEFEKERLIAVLNECAVCLNHEVDEVLDRILASFHIDSDLREPYCSGSSDEDLSMPRNSRKRKAPPPSSYHFCNHLHSIRQVYNNVQALQGRGDTCQEAVTKYSAELHSKLGKMEDDLEGLLNIMVSRCSRQMTLPEKYKLGKKIQKLPQAALDRVVEIIQTRNIPAPDVPDSVFVDLEEQDDVTLWRLHYFVELVMKENKL